MNGNERKRLDMNGVSADMTQYNTMIHNSSTKTQIRMLFDRFLHIWELFWETQKSGLKFWCCLCMSCGVVRNICGFDKY